MTVGELIEKLTAEPYDADLPVFIDDSYGSETWKIDEVKIGVTRIFIQVGERFDSDDDDLEDDAAREEAWAAFLDSGNQAEREDAS